ATSPAYSATANRLSSPFHVKVPGDCPGRALPFEHESMLLMTTSGYINLRRDRKMKPGILETHAVPSCGQLDLAYGRGPKRSSIDSNVGPGLRVKGDKTKAGFAWVTSPRPMRHWPARRLRLVRNCCRIGLSFSDEHIRCRVDGYR